MNRLTGQLIVMHTVQLVGPDEGLLADKSSAALNKEISFKVKHVNQIHSNSYTNK